ncbi:hypothetical protein EYB33_19060 [Lysinibacillus sphaericus]|uniref:hypothetical protein n=1 Tax=Lysinibacillus sphaericus TaxID=1421 RepID=UPI001E38AE4D|nr:hypothetical protein [Lysinibacillus sphaericus]MCS1384859.1 hypothetical protein [Lysinibacillus sphaericus]UDK98240.1 hypothetical protein EYB33_19060 [Lysinibacillus sphaericus]
MFKKKIMAFGLVASVFAASVSASAGTISSTSLTGTDASTSYYHLGGGDHVLKGTGTSGSGIAKAKKINRLFPDSTVAQIDVTSPYSSTDSFSAVSSTNGANQSYYIQWNGASKSASANVEISH